MCPKYVEEHEGSVTIYGTSKGDKNWTAQWSKRSTVEVKKAKDQLKAYDEKGIERILQGARLFPELLHIMLVIGEPGWGKSRLALSLAAVLKYPLYIG